MKKNIISAIIVTFAMLMAARPSAVAQDNLTTTDPLFVLESASLSDPDDVRAFPSRIEQYIPTSLEYQPKKARKLLVYVETTSFRTPGEPYVNELLNMLAEKTGAFEVEFSSNIDVFLSENLSKYDAFLLNSTVNMNKDGVALSEEDTPEICQSILDFVASGKGIIAMHGAVDNFNNWVAGQELIGNKFTGHPWTENGAWAVKIDEPDHPLTAPFKGHKGFRIVNEIYQTTSPVYSRDNQLVLMSLDMSDQTTASQVSDPNQDTGFSWIRTYGDGRIFYTVLGHGGGRKCLEFENPATIEHLLLGIQWALGDIDGVDTTPKGTQ